MVFAVAGRIGSGASFVKDGLVEELKAFGYKPKPIDITHLFLESEYEKVFTENKPTRISLAIAKDYNVAKFTKLDCSSQSKRIMTLQQRGNNLENDFKLIF